MDLLLSLIFYLHILMKKRSKWECAKKMNTFRLSFQIKLIFIEHLFLTNNSILQFLFQALNSNSSKKYNTMPTLLLLNHSRRTYFLLDLLRKAWSLIILLKKPRITSHWSWKMIKTTKNNKKRIKMIFLPYLRITKENWSL